jgi:hypothetical protein
LEKFCHNKESILKKDGFARKKAGSAYELAKI